MADERAENPSTEQAEAAMNRVLQAEREAEQAVAECEMKASEILSHAHQRANRITTLADERITLIKMRCSQRVTGQISGLERAEKKARQQKALELDESDLSECIEAVSAALTEGPES